ncbi:4-hydroxythreonine-4-phosphate dehydrogenase PdxA [Arcticibacterium luteifluviistationis]|uniref:4-hydroxythreonine-4-phosphate dehydrogenase PdxA n=1 Tax=Arcticibacterium luteifluviistationis TaxID=1784714 RepID=A0A2Z4G772_9BACT|nr:4-hydroxythreonine-4-phosphate dehydrogenase PdxA [Arcticibacterium luteifluviistationis]AWV96999.1 4-hydroxythreonine-4-phosphate dehydrogenase PdxA [Arcticibacterium luteifluviistationis]
MEGDNIPRIGISIGDINGIGPEVIIKALSSSSINKICTPVIYGSAKHLSKYKNLLGYNDWLFSTVQNTRQLNKKQINLINCYEGPNFELSLGTVQKEAGQLAFQALDRATQDLKNGYIEALVTAPISKDNTQGEGFKFPGHTEYLANEFQAEEVLMFLVSEELRLGVVTGHIPIEQVKKNITKKQIKAKLDLMLNSLKVDFKIQKPKIAVLGLNPHAGENGLLGKEEIEIIEPLINEYRKKGTLVFGTFPSDGFFATQQWKQFDAVLAMYHDQGLTPFKMLAFDSGVNFTAGLSAVRTSPDHGTAFDLAGKGEADSGSMLHAIFSAVEIYKNRAEYKELTENAISPVKIQRIIKSSKEKK